MISQRRLSRVGQELRGSFANFFCASSLSSIEAFASFSFLRSAARRSRVLLDQLLAASDRAAPARSWPWRPPEGRAGYPWALAGRKPIGGGPGASSARLRLAARRMRRLAVCSQALRPAEDRSMTAPKAGAFDAIDPAVPAQALRRRRGRAALGRRLAGDAGIYHYDPARPARRDLRDRHAAADRVGLAAPGPRVLATRTPTSWPATCA